ncbi:MAG TPA: SDR family oxidoreductase [Solirubrobacteraceae bacterium]|nr:SDR family oxidoreductase [Solirubrobacteraceae bacterium]
MRILLTGATGFLGMETLVRLAAAGDEVVCVIRGDDPAERLHQALDLVGVPDGHRDGLSAVAGDVTDPLPHVGPVDAVVHCAASVSFGLPLDEARRINVGGTRNALAAASRAQARYVHVSTAYVSGRHPGLFAEDDLDAGQPFRNTYEQTKAEAEAVVRSARDVDSVVLRPSIVVGESDTGWTPAFNVLYWPLRAFARGLLSEIPALPHGRVDVVPVDFVADAIAHVTRVRRDVTGTLALVAGEEAVTVDELLDLGAAAFGVERPRLQRLPDPAESAFAQRSEDAARYVPYFDMDVVFGDVWSRSVLRPAGIAPPPLSSYFDRIVAYAVEARWGKAPTARRVTV